MGSSSTGALVAAGSLQPYCLGFGGLRCFWRYKVSEFKNIVCILASAMLLMGFVVVD
jgi:hypothetical protein